MAVTADQAQVALELYKAIREKVPAAIESYGQPFDSEVRKHFALYAACLRAVQLQPHDFKEVT